MRQYKWRIAWRPKEPTCEEELAYALGDTVFDSHDDAYQAAGDIARQGDGWEAVVVDSWWTDNRERRAT